MDGKDKEEEEVNIGNLPIEERHKTFTEQCALSCC